VIDPTQDNNRVANWAVADTEQPSDAGVEIRHGFRGRIDVLAFVIFI